MPEPEAPQSEDIKRIQVALGMLRQSGPELSTLVGERRASIISFGSRRSRVGESATSGQARDDHAASLLTLGLIRAADDAPSSDSPYPTSRTMRSFNG
jgi:hypothetical protein